MQQKDKYLLGDRYVSEFMEKYEKLNLQGYNSGGYAYKESKKIFAKAEEENKAFQSGTMDISELAQSIKVGGSNDMSGMRRPTLMDRIKKGIGMRVDEAKKGSDKKKDEEIAMLDEEGYIQYRQLNDALLKKYRNPFR